MTPYLKLSGFQAGSGLPAIDRMAYDEAFGLIPNWLLLVDPDDVKGSGGTWNRTQDATDADVDAALLDITSSVNSGNNIGTFSSGQAAYSPRDSGYVQFESNVAFPDDAWSFFAVADPLPRAGSSVNLLTASLSYSDPELAPRLAFSPDGSKFVVYKNQQNADSNYRLSYTPAISFIGRRSLMMVTWSTREGLRIFENGIEVAADPNKNAPFTQSSGVGEWDVLSWARGDFGVMGLLGLDLGWAENAVYRRLIEAAMIDKYSIS